MLGVLASLPGCDRDEAIVVRKVRRMPPPDRMVVLMVLAEDTAWFFKVLGPAPVVQGSETQLNEFLKTLEFSDKQPAWELPGGWEEEEGDRMRFATLRFGPRAVPLELSVSSLPMPPNTDRDEYVLANVNRWRGQLGLSELTSLASDQSGTAETTEVAGLPAYRIILAGNTRDARRPSSMGPMGSMGAEQPEPSASAAVEVKYETPEGWAPGQPVPFSVVSLVTREGKGAKLTVSRLAAAAGELLPNVNRWRGQVGLEPLSAEQLSKEVQAVTIGGAAGSQVMLRGSAGQAILGVIVEAEGFAWFIKLAGETSQVEAETERFAEFLKSIQFVTEGAEDGN